MARHIDADKLLENLETFAPEHCTDLIKMLILKQPTEDVVEVVRCKDCEHSMEIGEMLVCNTSLVGKPILEVLKIGGACWTVVKPEDFCSNGKRKEGE